MGQEFSTQKYTAKFFRKGDLIHMELSPPNPDLEPHLWRHIANAKLLTETIGPGSPPEKKFTVKWARHYSYIKGTEVLLDFRAIQDSTVPGPPSAEQ